MSNDAFRCLKSVTAVKRLNINLLLSGNSTSRVASDRLKQSENSNVDLRINSSNNHEGDATY